MKTTYRILIVDDEENVRRMLTTAFSLQGHETHCASDGKAALSLFADTQPDVVLMDIRTENHANPAATDPRHSDDGLRRSRNGSRGIA